VPVLAPPLSPPPPSEGLGSQDFVAILRLFEEWAGVEADAREDKS
jgi:hypothetical protein